jgi:hypothetical protein
LYKAEGFEKKMPWQKNCRLQDHHEGYPGEPTW